MQARRAQTNVLQQTWKRDLRNNPAARWHNKRRPERQEIGRLDAASCPPVFADNGDATPLPVIFNHLRSVFGRHYNELFKATAAPLLHDTPPLNYGIIYMASKRELYRRISKTGVTVCLT